MENFNIIIASRLKDNPVAQFLSELGTNVKYVSLRRGEFVLSSDIGVKYMSDEQFAQSLENRSIYREMLDLKREFNQPIVIIEGPDPLHHPKIDLTTAHAALLFVSVVHRIPVLFAANEVETAQMLFMLTGQVDSGLIMEREEQPAKTTSTEAETSDPRRKIVETIPDVGPALADSLLKHFGSLTKLFTAGTDELRRVGGVGPKKAERIFNFSNGLGKPPKS